MLKQTNILVAVLNAERRTGSLTMGLNIGLHAIDTEQNGTAGLTCFQVGARKRKKGGSETVIG